MFILCLLLTFNVLAKTIIVSDIDDTIRRSNVLNKFDAGIRLFGTPAAFPGLDLIYKEMGKKAQLDGEKLPIVFISASLPFLYNGGAWLDLIKMPDFTVIQRQSLFHDAKEFKISNIKRFLEQEYQIGDQILMFGDNGEHDPVVYTQVLKDLGLEGKIFIRDVRADVSFYAPFKNGKRLPGIHYFLSELELVNIEPISSLDKATINKIVELAEKNKLIPSFMKNRIKKKILDCRRKYPGKASYAVIKCNKLAASRLNNWLKRVDSYLLKQIK